MRMQMLLQKYKTKFNKPIVKYGRIYIVVSKSHGSMKSLKQDEALKCEYSFHAPRLNE